MSNLKNDVLSGITVAVVALPLALAFGVASGAGPIAGLYGAIILGFFAALFGGTPTQISGPTGPMTVITATAIIAFPRDFSSAMTVIFLAGIIQIFLGLAGVGKWIKYIPYPVVSGFMSGVGVIIIILQINPFVGVQTYSSIIYTLSHVLDTFSKVNYEAFILAFITLSIMFLTPKRVSKIIPSALLALVLVTLLSVGLNFNVPTIGNIPSGIPDFRLPIHFDLLKLNTILTLAITLAVLGAIDSLLTSVVADSMTKTKHNSKKELIGQGIGNTICSFFGAIPGAGATMRTVVNINSGAKTNISGMVHSITLLVIALFLAPLASQVPLAVLSGILIKVGFDILDYKFLKILNKVSRQDLMIMTVVFLLTIFVDLIMAVGVGITIAAIIAVYQVSRTTQIKTSRSKISFDIDLDSQDVEIIKINGSLFFGTASHLDTTLEKIKDRKKVILDCKKISFLDISAIFTIEEIIEKFKDRNLEIILVLKYRHKRKVLGVDTTNVFKNIKIFNTLDDAINYTQKYELKND